MLKWVTALLCVLIAIAAVLAFSAWRTLHAPLLEGEATRIVDLPRGTTLRDLLSALDAQGIEHPAIWMRAYARVTGNATRLQAGEYRISAQDTAVELLHRIENGDVLAHRLTIVEGWTVAYLLELLATHPELTHDLPADDQTLKEVLGLPYLEGRFLPDTYLFHKRDSALGLLRRAALALEAELSAAWAQRAEALPYSSVDEALIVASLIEKETGRAEDRPEIASVFVNRLRLGMKLQTDPSVIYGLGDGFDGNLTRAHLRAATPYNTYVIGGLPPTPIALPGREAIRAALRPAQTDFLYFVARGDGTSEFSVTLEQHNAAVRRFQLGGRR